ncbi:hypothetical protein CYMTET_40042 [Cymbomonas tetramitiformis]|uniref:Uncharacterized protein n=1 Tax=Cymbomonas tetramitiformis TaxID=36881 RepID=A0AAE0CAM4_9CHLO|nr:hypothetical protein CYMTET_40042 [Cymbomonas tetramitiformis]
MYYYYQITNKRRVQRVCEVGFGAGHTATIALAGNSQVHVYSFDLFPEADLQPGTVEKQPLFQKESLKYIHQNFPGRFHQVAGSSFESVPAFANTNPSVKCDIMLIDGSHDQGAVLKDLVNMRALARTDTVVILDDMHVPLYRDLNEAIRNSLVELIECTYVGTQLDQRFAPSQRYDIGKTICQARYWLDRQQSAGNAAKQTVAEEIKTAHVDWDGNPQFVENSFRNIKPNSEEARERMQHRPCDDLSPENFLVQVNQPSQLQQWAHYMNDTKRELSGKACREPGRVAIVTYVSRSNQQVYAANMAASACYCNRHGYHFFVDMYPTYYQDRYGCYWNKLHVMAKYLHSQSFDWVVWLDADIVISNHELRLCEVLEGIASPQLMYFHCN